MDKATVNSYLYYYQKIESIEFEAINEMVLGAKTKPASLEDLIASYKSKAYDIFKSLSEDDKNAALKNIVEDLKLSVEILNQEADKLADSQSLFDKLFKRKAKQIKLSSMVLKHKEKELFYNEELLKYNNKNHSNKKPFNNYKTNTASITDKEYIS